MFDILFLQSLQVRDAVRECLEKDPLERKDDDIEVLLDFMQHFRVSSENLINDIISTSMLNNGGTVKKKILVRPP